MPFTTSEARRITDTIGPQVVGDRCFLAYRDMLRKWRASTRWTTAHEIYRDLVSERQAYHIDIAPIPTDDFVAMELAWQVFFSLHVLPYELVKRTENGEIDF